MFQYETGYRLAAEIIKSVNAQSGLDCILHCMIQAESCRSVNFRKTTIYRGAENCELLETVDSDEPAGSLVKNESYDYLILLRPERVSLDKPSFYYSDISISNIITKDNFNNIK